MSSTSTQSAVLQKNGEKEKDSDELGNNYSSHNILTSGVLNTLLRSDVALFSFAAGKEMIDAQSLEQLAMLKHLGVSQVLVCVTNLASKQWAQSRYRRAIQQLTAVSFKAAGFTGAQVTFIPLCELSGENIFQRTQKRLNSWYHGPTLYQALNFYKLCDARHSDRLNTAPMRLLVTNILDENRANGKRVQTKGNIKTNK